MALVGLSAKPASAQQGFSVVGPLTATGTEEVEQIVNYGKSMALFIRDEALWQQTRPLIGTTVRFTLGPE